MSHLEERLEKDLAEIRTSLARQAEQVEVQLRNAVRALQTGSRDQAYQTVLNDHPINREMRRIDRLCHSFIAVHLPSGSHLRLLSSAIRCNIELERIGDYAVTISREAVQLPQAPGGEIERQLDSLADGAQTMFGQSIKAFNDLNADLALGTMGMADPVEHNLNEIYAAMMRGEAGNDLKELFAIFVIFTNLKRVVDQAKNLCEETVFAVTGVQKRAKAYHLLFVDRDGAFLGPMAEAIANKIVPDSGVFSTAAVEPGAIEPGLAAFCESHALELGDTPSQALSDIPRHILAEQHVVISLGGPAEGFLEKLPFHTSGLNWPMKDVEGEGEARYESTYRELALRISDLMSLIRGDE
ncbi:MAG: PhoU domain-containing protein [Candidatus Sedimenticola sp. PURPLELP]